MIGVFVSGLTFKCALQHLSLVILINFRLHLCALNWPEINVLNQPVSLNQFLNEPKANPTVNQVLIAHPNCEITKKQKQRQNTKINVISIASHFPKLIATSASNTLH